MRKIFKLLFPLSLLFFSWITVSSQNQNVSINNTGLAPDPSAILDVSSADRGLLIPRMTTAQRLAIPSPAKSLLVFDNTLDQFWYFNGNTWAALSGGGTGGGTLDDAYNFGGAGAGRIINISSAVTPVEINTSIASSTALSVSNSSTGVALSADASGTSNPYATVQVTTNSNYGTVGGTPSPTAAIIASSSGKAYGLYGQIESSGTGESGVFGNNLRTTGGYGVLGIGYYGIVGLNASTDVYAVFGSNAGTTDPAIGVAGVGVTGIAGQSTDLTLSYGILSYDDAGVTNILDVGGDLNVGGTKSFLINHPLKKDKYLKHFCLESPEVLNVYRGNVTLDSNGEARVYLPDYFAEINTEFSYQLTPIGERASLYVKEKIKENTFSIAGGKAGLEVSWVVYAERNDQYMKDHPDSRNTEIDKTDKMEKIFNPSASRKDLFILDGQNLLLNPRKQNSIKLF
jgi:hypothetical protein